MDIATIIGILAGLVLIFASIVMGGSPTVFIDVPSMLIVFGGTVAATLIAYPLNEVLSVMKVIPKVFKVEKSDFNRIIQDIAKWATLARQNGMLALETEAKKTKNKLIQMGLQMLSDGIDGGTIQQILQGELMSMQKRHQVGRNIFKDMGAYAPAFGMIGTLIGLVQMLSNLNDPSSIGPAMAVALLTTFYGAFLANVFFNPMAVKLKRKSEMETLEIELIIKGLMAIQRGDNPKVVVDKLKIYLDAQSRQMLEKKGAKK
ncbi:MAG: motility protein A [Calditrichia bacterium]